MAQPKQVAALLAVQQLEQERLADKGVQVKPLQAQVQLELELVQGEQAPQEQGQLEQVREELLELAQILDPERERERERERV